MADQETTRIDALFADDYGIVAFRDLPLPHKMAMAWYMAVDGEAWSDVLDDASSGMPSMHDNEGADWHAFWKRAVADLMPEFDRLHGDVPFGIATIPTEAMILSISRDDVVVEDGLTLEAVRTNYASGGRHGAYPEHGPNDRWPVILSSHDDETLQDGWHRFGSYAGAGHPDIPAIFYPEARHFAARNLPVPPSEREESSGFRM